MARSNPPSRVFPINTDANAAKVMRTWILTLPPAMSIDASSAADICAFQNDVELSLLLQFKNKTEESSSLL